MEISQNPTAPAASLAWATRKVDRNPQTTVPAVRKADGPATLPANKPFVGQVVSAKLGAMEPVDDPVTPQQVERTLRPFGVPMLPYDKADQAVALTWASDQDQMPVGPDDPLTLADTVTR